MDDAIASIVAFVEGRTEPADFETRLYNDPAIEAALNDDPTLKPGTYIGASTFLFVVEQDFESPGGVLNVHGALSQFLERKQIPFRPTKAYSQLYDIILKAQPGWLNVPVDWLKKNVLSAADGRKGKELRVWLREPDENPRLLSRRSGSVPFSRSNDWPLRNGDSGILSGSGEQSVVLDRAGITVFRDITFLAAGPASERSRSARRGGWMGQALSERAQRFLQTWERRLRT
jgi:hypothetical protein